MTRAVALTGATGFVGQETLDQLLTAGFTVRALTRRTQIERDGITWVSGALDNIAALRALVNDADVVLHIAGAVNAHSRADFEAGNSSGTANVITAMHQAGVRRLVHVSSLAARQPALSDYCWSKAQAEDHVRASALDWTMVRPPAVYGPRDTEFSELLRVARLGILPVPPAGRSSLIHVRDLARLLLSLSDDASESHYGATWEVDDDTPNGYSHPELAAAFAQALGRNVRAIPLPRFLLLGFAGMDIIARGRGAKLTPDRVRYMCYPDWVADPEKKPPIQFWSPRIGPNAGLAEIAVRYRS